MLDNEILRNEKYTGTYVYNRSSSKSAREKYNRHKYKDEEEIISIPNCIPAIVSKEQYDAVQQKFKRRQYKGACNKAKEPYLLSGKVVCGKCGSSFVGNFRRAYDNHIAYASYRCNCKNRAIRCNNREIEKHEMEGLVLEMLADKVFDEGILPRLEHEYTRYLSEQQLEDDVVHARLLVQQKQLTKEIKNVVALMARTGSIALFEKLKELEQQNSIIASKLSEIGERGMDNKLEGEELRKVFRKAKLLLTIGGLQSRQALVNAFVKR